ncbi:MAG: hypothetical protein RBR09_10330 [Desulfobulbaceae bacterium]|jgi:hypothetical protein|nr:hypothetical protein [Desulfobulbaceae bacterium]MDY0351638.1 hypothetical protein [Desulfobulbaceae bacterium]
MKTWLRNICIGTFFSLIMLLPLAGCMDKTAGPIDPGLPPVSGFAGDLQDIELPTQMEWIREKSMTVKTESFNGGIWKYSGRVEPLSLKDFIINSMQNNKWKLVGEATSGETLLAFAKPSKTCMMVISESRFGKTGLTLYVTIDRAAAASLNPFGEATDR